LPGELASNVDGVVPPSVSLASEAEPQRRHHGPYTTVHWPRLSSPRGSPTVDVMDWQLYKIHYFMKLLPQRKEPMKSGGCISIGRDEDLTGTTKKNRKKPSTKLPTFFGPEKRSTLSGDESTTDTTPRHATPRHVKVQSHKSRAHRTRLLRTWLIYIGFVWQENGELG
jgi:hypothetical protein